MVVVPPGPAGLKFWRPDDRSSPPGEITPIGQVTRLGQAGVGVARYLAFLPKAAAAAGKVLTAVPGSYGLTGSATIVLHKWTVAVGASSYALIGTAAALAKLATPKVTRLGQAGVGVAKYPPFLPKTAAAAARVLTAVSGSYALTGTAAALTKLANKSLLAASGSYALNGAVATILEQRKITASVASYALAGVTVALTKANRLQAISGSYTLTGTIAGVGYGRKLAATAGGYALNGAVANIEYGRKLAAGAANYAVAGADATLKKITGRFVSADPGSYALTGNPALVLHHWTLAASGGWYALTGSPVTLPIVPVVAPPIFGGGDVSKPPRPHPVEGTAEGILPPLEGEAFGVVIGAGVGQGQLPRLEAWATGSIGAAGKSQARVTIKVAACGCYGQRGAAAATIKIFAAASSGRVGVCGNGYGMILKQGAAFGEHNDDEAAVVTFLLAA